MESGERVFIHYFRPFLTTIFNFLKFLLLVTSNSTINLTASNVQLAEILNILWFPYDTMISVKVGNNSAPVGLAVSNMKTLFMVCLLKNMFLGDS